MRQALFLVLSVTCCVDRACAGRGCSPGNFGWKCKFQCACRRGPCDKNTGWCESGCQEGKYGVGCQLVNECLYDSQGVNYTGTLDVGNEGKKCISWSHPFVQGEGYTLDKFPPGDNPKNYCRNPKNNYGKYGVKPWCFFSTRLKKNFVTCGQLKRCSCPDGLFGAGCQSVCHCRTEDEVCKKLIGSCTSGCAAGWTGLSCQRTCPEGKYGQDCAQTCGHCYQKSCDPEYGECQKKCEEGYSGLYCTDKCPNSRYGRNCEGECGKCKDGEPCNKNTGICFRGCSNGYKGYKCDEKCPPGLYGKSCKLNCGYCKLGTTCDHVTGTCLSGCKAGKMGDNCTTGITASAEGKIIGIIRAVTIVAIILIVTITFTITIVLVAYRCRSRDEKQECKDQYHVYWEIHDHESESNSTFHVPLEQDGQLDAEEIYENTYEQIDDVRVSPSPDTRTPVPRGASDYDALDWPVIYITPQADV
ncbi:scavenger receptor class F member 1-like [Haliotis cracherodii]|uniref:scavenger receptor class F member 1-like n=1 Tax=Haliotis cracherodii TaxID=6455 RepID=UPI0039E9A10C